MKGIKAAAEYGADIEDEEEDEVVVQHKGKEVKKVTKHREDPVSQTQLATRVDSTLFRRIKIHCVETNTSIMEFVHGALVTELKRRTGKK